MTGKRDTDSAKEHFDPTLDIVKSRRGLSASIIQIFIYSSIVLLRHSGRHLTNQKQLLSSVYKENVMKTIFLHLAFLL